MKQSSLYWIDIIALIISIVIPFLLTFKVTRKAYGAVRGIAVYFLLFGPCAIFIHMCFHLIDVSYGAALAIIDGDFVYNFRFYALILMGSVLAKLSFNLIKAAIAKCLKADQANKKIAENLIYINLISIPTVFFTPIGSLPTIASLIILISLPFIFKKRVKSVDSKQQPQEWPDVIYGQQVQQWFNKKTEV